MKKQLQTVLCVSFLALTGCQGSAFAPVATRIETANTMAAANSMSRSTIAAAPFLLTAFVRISNPALPTRVYIEGDGMAWLGPGTPSRDPTPPVALGLQLATLDQSPNVVWIARPCQYSKMTDTSKPCPQEYWTGSRFAPEVISATNAAIDNIKSRHQLTGGIEITGYSGGGAVAVLAAANRTDVTGIRTVAGNLDHDALNSHHDVTLMPQSLNARDVAATVAHVPQIHYTGTADNIVPSLAFDSYLTAIPADKRGCVTHIPVSGATHDSGWDNAWPVLSAAPIPPCK